MIEKYRNRYQHQWPIVFPTCLKKIESILDIDPILILAITRAESHYKTKCNELCWSKRINANYAQYCKQNK